MINKKNILVVSAHPDDEVLGAGGTILKHSKNKDNIYWIIATSIFKNEGYSQKKVDLRKKEINLVKEKLGIKKIFFLNFPTSKLTYDSVLSMIPEISKIFKEISPNTIYCVNRNDAHSDHFFTFNAIIACSKSFRFPSIKKILLYECISETEFAPPLPERIFQPNYYVDISDFLKTKLDIMKIYRSELGDHPFPRSLKNIESLATFRGASVGVDYAEAFQLVKFIDN